MLVHGNVNKQGAACWAPKSRSDIEEYYFPRSINRSTPGWIRTIDLLIRSQLLYPAELPGPLFLNNKLKTQKEPQPRAEPQTSNKSTSQFGADNPEDCGQTIAWIGRNRTHDPLFDKRRIPRACLLCEWLLLSRFAVLSLELSKFNRLHLPQLVPTTTQNPTQRST